ncbi:Hypothetical protein NTJ_10537 [Nesidiocoris tenuis]|uniref:Uncharacterized protein n=1 Tax=Nesidiocoris tenuis TaxID=355587 RepID=A0ABN7AZX1_9HEMI|nr:Hypothetical protein NTJ_10537 [Nesidiocoris tenuis]
MAMQACHPPHSIFSAGGNHSVASGAPSPTTRTATKRAQYFEKSIIKIFPFSNCKHGRSSKDVQRLTWIWRGLLVSRDSVGDMNK